MTTKVRNKYGNEVEDLGNEDATKQEKGLVESSDVIGLGIGSLGPISRTIKNTINNGTVMYKPINAGWGTFAYEQGLEQAVQNQLQKESNITDTTINSKQIDRVPMFTLSDMMSLQKAAKTDPIAAEQYNEAVHGGYLLTRDQANSNVARKLTGEHLPDSGEVGLTGLGLPSGKLPSHITYSKESPYAIGLGSTQAGEWTRNGEQWTYAPSERQVAQPGYTDRLLGYANSGADEGLGTVVLPNNEIRNTTWK